MGTRGDKVDQLRRKLREVDDSLQQIQDGEDIVIDSKVVHCKRAPFDVYIGRPSIWGNPFTHIDDRKTAAQFIVSSREEAIQKYREWVVTQPDLMARLPELVGKTLGCWCFPKSCHGDVLIDLVRTLETE